MPLITPQHIKGQLIYQLSYVDIASFSDILQVFKDHQGKQMSPESLELLRLLNLYCCLPQESYSYLSFGDSDANIQGGKKGGVLEVINERHKETVTAQSYSQFVKMCKPNIYVAPSELIVEGAGKKRTSRAAKQGARFVEQCVKYKAELNITQSYLLAPLIVATDFAGAVPPLQQLAKIESIDGISILTLRLPLLRG